MPADRDQSIPRAHRWAVPVLPEVVQVLVVLVPALADLRARDLVAHVQERAQHRLQPKRAGRSAPRRAAVDAASSSTQRPKKGR